VRDVPWEGELTLQPISSNEEKKRKFWRFLIKRRGRKRIGKLRKFFLIWQGGKKRYAPWGEKRYLKSSGRKNIIKNIPEIMEGGESPTSIQGGEEGPLLRKGEKKDA